MIEELCAARNQLNLALDRYINACSAIQSCCIWETTTSKGPPQLESLVGCAAEELLLFKSYRSKLNKAQAAMSVARNCSPTLAPINSLPAEILSRIFQVILDMQPCFNKSLPTVTGNHAQAEDRLEYPDLLLLVCYLWRQILIGDNTIWSHIDLAPQHPLHQVLLTRANAYAIRAGQSLLDVHIAAPGPSRESDRTDLVQFIVSVAKRIRSLKLVASNFLAKIHISVIHTCFSYCIPGVLTRLHMEHTGFGGPYFIVPTDDSQDQQSFSLDLPQDHLERTWLPVVSLSLVGIYPLWTSQAYRGLTELRLFPKGTARPPFIAESQLVSILRANPKLRAFYFNLTLTDILPKQTLITPVHLDELEILNAGHLPYDKLEALLRWFAPSRSPLQLSVDIPSSSEWTINDPSDEVNRFLSRFEVSTLCLDGLDAYLTQVIDLLNLTQGLRVLVVKNFGDPDAVSDPDQNTTMKKNHNLAQFYMLGVPFYSHSIQILGEMSKNCFAEKVAVWDCVYYHDNHSPPDEKALTSSILNIYPNVQFVSRYEVDPTNDWPLMGN